MRSPLDRPCWIFDLDGTLTVAQHDFPAISRALGLPPGPILERLEELPEERRAAVELHLAQIEEDIAQTAKPAEGAIALLRELKRRGAALGILTRNTGPAARITLEATGLLRWFPTDSIVAREDAQPKPDPAGIHVHLRRWGCSAEHSVMVGDFAFDLQAGRAAGSVTVYVDPSGRFPHRGFADWAVRRLDELLGDSITDR